MHATPYVGWYMNFLCGFMLARYIAIGLISNSYRIPKAYSFHDCCSHISILLSLYTSFCSPWANNVLIFESNVHCKICLLYNNNGKSLKMNSLAYAYCYGHTKQTSLDQLATQILWYLNQRDLKGAHSWWAISYR